MRRGGGIVLIAAMVLVLLYLMLQQQSPKVGDYDGPQMSWFDRLLGDDAPADFGSGEAGAGYYFSSFFDGFEFRFKVKDYRAMRDDDLNDAD